MRQGRVSKSAGRGVLLAAALCLCASSSGAQEPLLTLRTLRDAGGLSSRLNARLTTALLRFLSDHSEHAFQAAIAPAPSSLASVPRYTLEGELSCANGRGEDNARFLLVTRLYREEKYPEGGSASQTADKPGSQEQSREKSRRVLVGQWAGTSTSLRALTVNLRRDPRFHTLGLVGEIGSRIVTALTADQASAGSRWRRLLPPLTGRPFPTEVGLVDGANRSLHQVPVGSAFRVRAAGATVQRAYLLAGLSDGELRVLPLADTGEELQTASGKVTLSRTVTLPEDAREIWIVCRMAANTKSAAQEWGKGRRLNCGRSEDDAPVHLLEGVGSDPPAVNSSVTHLLDAIAREPMVWRAARIRILISSLR